MAANDWAAQHNLKLDEINRAMVSKDWSAQQSLKLGELDKAMKAKALKDSAQAFYANGGAATAADNLVPEQGFRAKLNSAAGANLPKFASADISMPKVNLSGAGSAVGNAAVKVGGKALPFINPAIEFGKATAVYNDPRASAGDVVSQALDGGARVAGSAILGGIGGWLGTSAGPVGTLALGAGGSYAGDKIADVAASGVRQVFGGDRYSPYDRLNKQSSDAQDFMSPDKVDAMKRSQHEMKLAGIRAQNDLASMRKPGSAVDSTGFTAEERKTNSAAGEAYYQKLKTEMGAQAGASNGNPATVITDPSLQRNRDPSLPNGMSQAGVDNLARMREQTYSIEKSNADRLRQIQFNGLINAGGNVPTMQANAAKLSALIGDRNASTSDRNANIAELNAVNTNAYHSASIGVQADQNNINKERNAVTDRNNIADIAYKNSLIPGQQEKAKREAKSAEITDRRNSSEADLAAMKARGEANGNVQQQTRQRYVSAAQKEREDARKVHDDKNGPFNEDLNYWLDVVSGNGKQVLPKAPAVGARNGVDMAVAHYSTLDQAGKKVMVDDLKKRGADVSMFK